MPNFIFGYGSLISKESRDKTGDSGPAIPARVSGLSRGWIIPSLPITPVGAVVSVQSSCNGVIVEMPENSLEKFDEREIPYGYKRIELDRKDIEVLDNRNLPEGKFWTYVATKTGEAGINNPIAQSYVDVVISGCLDFGDEFAEEFIKTTTGWNGRWINDRENPLYSRYLSNNNLSDKIDDILRKNTPNYFKKRREL